MTATLDEVHRVQYGTLALFASRAALRAAVSETCCAYRRGYMCAFLRML